MDLPFQTHRGFHPPDAMTSLGDPELECGRVAGSLPAVSRFGAAATVRVRNMGKNILVIDDDVDFLRLVEHTLKPYGYDPEIKASGQAGLDYFEKNGMSNEIIKFYWESPSQTKEYVPEKCLLYPGAR